VYDVQAIHGASGVIREALARSGELVFGVLVVKGAPFIKKLDMPLDWAQF
jgi:hypothetical protein